MFIQMLLDSIKNGSPLILPEAAAFSSEYASLQPCFLIGLYLYTSQPFLPHGRISVTPCQKLSHYHKAFSERFQLILAISCGKVLNSSKREKTDTGKSSPQTEKRRGHSSRHSSTLCIYASPGFSTSAIALFFIGIRQFLLLPNSTIQSSSVMSITTP